MFVESEKASTQGSVYLFRRTNRSFMDDDIRTVLYESNRLLTEQSAHLKWICRTLEEMKAASADLEVRVRSLEEWRAEHTGVEKKMAVWAGAFGAVAGVVVGVMLELMVG